MSRLDPLKKSEPRHIHLGGLFGDAFGNPIVTLEGPFADDYTTLSWIYKEHRDGETASFRVAGLDVYVCDQDGDASYWRIKDVRTRQIVAEGEDWGSDPCHFFFCLNAAEKALRAEVDRRKIKILSEAHR